MLKNEKFRKFLYLMSSMMISLFCFFLGLVFFSPFAHGFAICLIIVILLAVILIGNLYWKRTFLDKLKKTPIKEQMDILLMKHKNAQTGLEAAILRLKNIQRNILAYFLLLTLLACALSFFSGTTIENLVVYPILSTYILYGVIFCLSPPPEEYDETLYVSEKEFPYLYKIANKAMTALNISGKIRIMILPDWNAGIAKMNNFFSLQLGAEMLYMLTEEELYHVLLHEFGHLADPYSREYLTPKYMTRFRCNEFDSDMAYLTMFLVSGVIQYYNYESEIFDITTSKTMERRADMKACTVGNSSIYASALVKMALHEYFDFESNDYLMEPYYAPEKPRSNVTTLMTTTFSKALEERKDFWLELLEKQLPPLMDSHPSFTERYASIGKPGYKLDFPIRNIDESNKKNALSKHSPSKTISYEEDCRKAIQYADKLIYEQLNDNYKEERDEHYKKPLALLDNWKKDGGNIHDTNIADIIKAMDALCKYQEAEELCDRIINESDNVYMTAFPLLYKGNRMLHRYEKDGIELIYHGIDLNPNLISTGLDIIGSYCQHTGLEEELAEYRKKVPLYAQKETDYNDDSGDISKSDHLIPEHFPDNRLEEIVDYMITAGKKKIDKIYLVRKVVNEDTYYSIFIIKWSPDVEPETLRGGMDKIFNYLDTYPDGWPYSLFLWDKHLDKIVQKVENACVYSTSKVNDK